MHVRIRAIPKRRLAFGLGSAWPGTQAHYVGGNPRQRPSYRTGAGAGNFELDLERAGVLPELFMGQNILLTQAYERATVFYGRNFTYNRPITGREALMLEGVDTYADFYLNGRLIGSTDNALIPHRLPLPGLRQGENELVCVLRSCLSEADSHPVSVGEYALAYNYASLRVRKGALCLWLGHHASYGKLRNMA